MSTHKVAGLFATLCCLLGPPLATPAMPPIHLTPGQRASITNIVMQAMKQQRIPGMVVAVAVAGHPIYEKAFGDRVPGKAADVSTIFPLGSITKQFTSACVMWLVERRRVDLDYPIKRYVGNVPHAGEITVRELLDQTSGLVSYTDVPALKAALGKGLMNSLSSAQLLAFIDNKPLKFAPGTKYEYSNTNYVLAGMIVEAVSGETYEEFLRKHIVVPVGMTRTQYLRTSVPVGGDVAIGYEIKSGLPTPLPAFSMSWASSAGALASDVNDMVKWDDAFFHGRIVAPALVHTMTAISHTGEKFEVPFQPGMKAYYGYAWVNSRFDGYRMIWHNGGFPGDHTMNAYFPSSDMEIVVLTNLAESKPEAVVEQVYATALPEERKIGPSTSD
jgi:D-alanyl-D-alanine carboxypeptidase